MKTAIGILKQLSSWTYILNYIAKNIGFSLYFLHLFLEFTQNYYIGENKRRKLA